MRALLIPIIVGAIAMLIRSMMNDWEAAKEEKRRKRRGD